MRRWVLVFAITSLFGLAPSHAAADGKTEFLRWVSEIARAKKVSVCRAGQLRYQGEAPGYFAALGDPKLDPESTPIVLFSNGTKHWSYEETALTVHAGGMSPPVVWEQLDLLTIHAQDMATKYLWDEEDVTFVEGEPVMLREVHSNIDGDATTDWLAATVEHTKSDPPSPEGPEEGANGMLILLPPGSRWLKSWKAPTFVSFGDKNRQGPADANLAIQALDLGKTGIRIVADVTDDRAVPTPARADAKALIRSDHLELWWVPVGVQDAKQLGIGMRADGPLRDRPVPWDPRGRCRRSRQAPDAPVHGCLLRCGRSGRQAADRDRDQPGALESKGDLRRADASPQQSQSLPHLRRSDASREEQVDERCAGKVGPGHGPGPSPDGPRQQPSQPRSRN